MHIAGINWVAVLVAAAAFFAIGFVIHMKLVDLKAWDAAKHTDQAKLSKGRMASGMVLPLATAIGLAVLFSWADVTGVADGIKWGLVVALASGLPVLWYNWFYGTAPIWIFWVDSAHQLIGHAVVGAILAGWRARPSAALEDAFQMYARDVPAGQIFYHGTKADLNVGDLIGPGFGSNCVERALNHIYFSATLEAATWGAGLARAALGVVGHPHFNIHVVRGK